MLNGVLCILYSQSINLKPSSKLFFIVSQLYRVTGSPLHLSGPRSENVLINR